MIEDDLRIMLSASSDVPVYSRIIPAELPECITVAEIGGRFIKAGIHKTDHIITLLSVSRVQATAAARLREARDLLITSMPTEAGGLHYYTATSLGDGSIKRKAAAGPVFIEYTDLEVLTS